MPGKIWSSGQLEGCLFSCPAEGVFSTFVKECCNWHHSHLWWQMWTASTCSLRVIFFWLQVSAMFTRLKHLQKLSPRISSVPSSVIRTLILSVWPLQVAWMISWPCVSTSVPGTPRSCALLGVRSAWRSPISLSMDNGMHVTMAPVSTLPWSVAGFLVWNLTLARGSQALRLPLLMEVILTS